MSISKTKLKSLSEIRFGSMIFLFRMAGIPFKMNNLKPLYTIYMVITIVSTYSTFIGVYVQAYKHREDLGSAMTILRALITFTNVMWTFSYCR